MSTIRVDSSRCSLCGECVAACPFGAVEMIDGSLHFSEACRLCRICIRRCPHGALALEEERPKGHASRGTYRDVLIFAEQHEAMSTPSHTSSSAKAWNWQENWAKGSSSYSSAQV